MEYSIAIDPFSGEALVMEKSTDFDGWVVLFHVGSLVEAHKTKQELEAMQAQFQRR